MQSTCTSGQGKSSVSMWLRAAALGGVMVAVLGVAAPAAAQLSRVGGAIATLQPGGVWRGVDTAYDPVNDIYLVVTAYGDVRGVFTNGAGTPITAAFTIHSGTFGHFPNAEYSPDVSNGAGGLGGFIVIWNDNASGNSVRARIVSHRAPGYLVSGVHMISDPAHGTAYFENRPVVAYSRTSRRFLVVWTTGVPSFGLQGRLVGTHGGPISGVLRLDESTSRDPALTWNPANDHFGLGNSAWGCCGAYTVFRLVRAADGFVSGRSSLGHGGGTYATGIDVNSANQFVFAWGRHPGTTSATLSAVGTLLGTSFVSDRIGGDLSLGLSFNPAVGRFLVVSSDWFSLNVAASELFSSGAPVAAAAPITAESRASYYPLPAARTGTNQWNVVYSPNYVGATNQIVATGGGGAAPPPPPPPPTGGSTGCSTPDPFVSLGGGTCVNGGWLPPGSRGSAPAPPPPPPPPPPSSSGCTTSDPFVSLGGGRCVNGGWLPPGSPSAPAPAPPPPAPAPSTCSTPAPGAGWTCVKGGWLPPGHPGAVGVAPSGSTGGCSTPDPFVSIGGGTCVNGGWTPGPACVGSDPFVSIGGGVCVGGGWIPRAR